MQRTLLPLFIIAKENLSYMCSFERIIHDYLYSRFYALSIHICLYIYVIFIVNIIHGTATITNYNCCQFYILGMIAVQQLRVD